MVQTVEGSKCIKFENRVRLEIKQGINYQEIRRFPTLVNKCKFMMRTTGLVLLTTRVLVRGKERICLRENHAILQLKKVSRGLQMRKS